MCHPKSKFNCTAVLLRLMFWTEHDLVGSTELSSMFCAQIELYESRMKQAACLEQLGRSPVDKLKEAAWKHPSRAEPFAQIARWHNKQGALCKDDTLCEAEHHMGAYLYAKRVWTDLQRSAAIPQNLEFLIYIGSLVNISTLAVWTRHSVH